MLNLSMHFGINNNDIDVLTDVSNQLHNGDELTTLMDSDSVSINDGSITTNSSMHFGINNNDIDVFTDVSNQLHNGDELTTLSVSINHLKLLNCFISILNHV